MPVTTDARCDQCGKPFQVKRNNKTGPKFCGNACRQRAHRQKTQGKKTASSSFKTAYDITAAERERIAREDPDTWNRVCAILEVTPEGAQFKRPYQRLNIVEGAASNMMWQRNRLAEEVERLETKVARAKADWWNETRRSEQYLDWWREGQSHINGLLSRINELENALKNGESGGLSSNEWQRLRAFDDTQLRNWVKAGATMARRGHEEAMSNAVRWVEGNSPQALERPEALQTEP